LQKIIKDYNNQKILHCNNVDSWIANINTLLKTIETEAIWMLMNELRAENKMAKFTYF
jgi:hypothetical protein